MTAVAGSSPFNAASKKVVVGLPTTIALVSVAYSSPLTNGPGPKDKPSGCLKYLMEYKSYFKFD